jgi:Tfp pilus assembly protein FimT
MTVSRSHHRNAFSLIELILVMGVIVMIFSLAIPLATRALGTHALRQSADRVRVAMGEARVEAIKSGQIHALFFQINSDWFNVAPFSQISAQQGLAARQIQLNATQVRTSLEENQLPNGIVFADGMTSNDGRSADTLSRSGGGSSLIKPILFYPDGTAQDARVFLRDDQFNSTSVQLRGLTGIAKTVRR